MILPARIILLSILIGVIGFIALAYSGQITSAPFAILLGTFIIGFSTREVKYGALAGLFVSVVVAIIFLIILGIVFFLSIFFVITLVLAFFFNIIWALFAQIAIYFIYVIVLSPIVGATGGFFGRLIIGQKKEGLSQVPQTQVYPGYTSKVACPYCGATNDISNRFCFRCGNRLH